ncbi:MAG: D-aminoacyl-tRNA deacylase [Tissierellia bacterium]|nr:D-aminoacyl-tRNA deacylase [Tissierellia bacterium]
MRALVQKVKKAKVEVDNKEISKIQKGLLVFIAVTEEDCQDDLDYIKRKIENLRIFEDDQGKMNLSIKQVSGEFLIVSQFTLYGDARKGNRPSFIRASAPEKGEKYYKNLIEALRNDGFTVKEGSYGADMDVSLINDGPCTIQLDSERIY